jgi:serine protease Do
MLLVMGVPSLFAAETPAATETAAPNKAAPPKTIDELKAFEQQVEKIVAQVSPSTVGLQIGGGRGSGVIVSEDGLVMTAGHVVTRPNMRVTITFSDGKTAVGRTLGRDVPDDAGLIRITTPGKWPYAELGQSGGLKEGTWCLALGHPGGYQAGRPPVVRLGRILRNVEDALQTDCTLISGDSGGPLFDLEGKVIGIHTSIGESTDLNLHIPVDIFRDNWNRLLRGEMMWRTELHGRDSNEVKAVFRQIVAEAGRSTVRIRCNGVDAALGAVVGADGWIITKASQLSGRIVCRLYNNRDYAARTIGVSQQYDLAMLKIEATGLPTVQWSKAEPVVGQWLAVPGPAGEPLGVGVLSVTQRKIPPINGMLGVVLQTGEGAEARITRVYPNSAAEIAGLKIGDVITHVNGKATATANDLIAAIKQLHAGDSVRLNVKRGESTLAIPARLLSMEAMASATQEEMNRSGVGVSQRRDDFPAVLQHDTVVRPVDCGGPLVDSSGKVIGINIARGGRTETYCVSAEVVTGLLADLMSGKLAPPDASKAAAEKKTE